MIEDSRLRLRDLLSEAQAGLLQRPMRSVLTMLGTILGVGAFVAVLGLTATAGGQIDKRFTELAATEVNVDDIGGDALDSALSFRGDSSARVQALNGVVHAGVWWPVPLRLPVIAAAPGTRADSGGLNFTAAEPSALATMRPVVRTGRLYDDFHSGRSERVAVLGSAAAARLGITRLDGHPAVFVDNMPYTVLGILDDVARRPEVLLSVIIPTTTALAAYGPPVEDRAKMLIETELGAAGLIASQAALALRPDAPERFSVVPPPDPQALRGSVTNDLNVLFLLLATISLVIGAVGIANTTLVAVLERTNEIGLRRTLGARPVHVAAQFLSESTTLGLLGGLIGTSLGVVTVVAVAYMQQWTALLEPVTVLPTPFVGGIVGLLAGAYPAMRAARIEPVEALGR
jgi:putative ABC transport system permease protein